MDTTEPNWLTQSQQQRFSLRAAKTSLIWSCKWFIDSKLAAGDRVWINPFCHGDVWKESLAGTKDHVT